MFYLISKDPMTQYLLRIENSFCNDNFRINFLLFFSHLSPHNDRAIVIVLMGSLNSRMGVSSLTHLTDTGLVVELEHLKTNPRLIDEKFSSVRGECET